MNNPSELKYGKGHLWVKSLDDGSAEIGLTDHAQNSLGEFVSLEIPAVGDSVKAGESFGEIESAKTVSELLAPISGTISDLNEDIEENPEKINDAPYDSWVLKIKDVSDAGELLSAEEYEAFCKAE